ncbi:TetR family transcriptional regulator C-terminal domain-containing protein [Salinimicrobium oceani]|uniref:TetR/AcrR family transcriptional regulator n=1 Tax=Salinimicrobium oceani TaxID=2722702 RepID=A0ABX1CTY4_9FLAO|nr:TetR family transcriptional regulator C-terminal domain-containing protein [Salinimicrobium oceani]NJW51732.1 TetR/AcrR family transcriptional regulator [Salinimicrobium oceani]
MTTIDQKENAEAQLNEERLIELYMEYVLEKEEEPGTVYKFTRLNKISETDFYNFFGSFDGLKKRIWERFFELTLELMEKSKEFSSFNNREKMLTLYYTFFEMLTANRSYVLFTLKNESSLAKNVRQLSGLRRELKNFTAALVRTQNEEKQSRLLKNSETVFSEAAWVQMMFLLKFWLDDNSPQFESTDVAIEKSVNTVFDLFENSPLERVVDLGKFLWKEKMS